MNRFIHVILPVFLLVSGLLLFILGPIVNPRPNSEMCNASIELVRRQILGGTEVKRSGDCEVESTGSTHKLMHKLKGMYSTPLTRRDGTPPYVFEANIAYDGETYSLCALTLPGREEKHFTDNSNCVN